MTDWRWIGLPVILAIHDRQIAEHGGLPGLRDSGALESALARPLNLTLYGVPDAADLAAAYAFGLTRNHPFADGNKRIAWIAARLFFADNGGRLFFEKTEAMRLMQALAAGEIDERQLADWFRQRLS
ncbi:Death ON curing protein [uncultured Pleomorphomonas sp.]|uniref:Death ON curing protein n=1 Tax=uncultured Pleomorphomonas sp. TaxID=442121 RepID=A0A212L8N7_9HYPH|nr:type II toxin-antitoxin system death-on-curing family toxin [uncultured Pleomorphomonas sp.]SCM73699.1 Death ON curing protein [uncultured Pleomorphomonas sp.]